ncbi:hypothetical protein Despr_2420 [Desulfobulbus propionicus DSM 2032]|uniref:Uncharacterized protein n=1 Tax=Desulfobulbus propionicus (strain ATCC 33891 / DSM 2032 / VKM B-1956 / 1pr3) TaxID=577650 RepID=A0A7U3YND6_DESPD|nr:hypothetical protein [Desulfobulbus propionicus]ADW16370.1 hypothetical protein Despr_0181 [Desulfobulbus propionicus DSM 2032]ADW18561.1 hypothetical protein Despr_2420 [Desulfobulbus propionicus DSM 2032]
MKNIISTNPSLTRAGAKVMAFDAQGNVGHLDPDAVTSVAGKTGAVTLANTDVSNVTALNTSYDDVGTVTLVTHDTATTTLTPGNLISGTVLRLVNISFTNNGNVVAYKSAVTVSGTWKILSPSTPASGLHNIVAAKKIA